MPPSCFSSYLAQLNASELIRGKGHAELSPAHNTMLAHNSLHAIIAEAFNFPRKT